MANNKTGKALTLYMTAWQKRIMRDFMPSSSFRGKSYEAIDKMVIKPKKNKCLVSYLIPMVGIKKGDWLMYLTDEQMTMVGEFLKAKTPIPSINVKQEFLDEGIIAFR